MELSKRLKILRMQKNWTQEALGKQLFVSRKTVSSWEVGRTIPDIDSLIKLSELYGVSLDYLIKEDNRVVTSLVERVKKHQLTKKLLFFSVIVCLLLGILSLYQWQNKKISHNTENEFGLKVSDFDNQVLSLVFDPNHELFKGSFKFSGNKVRVLKEYQLDINPNDEDAAEKITQKRASLKEAGKFDEDWTEYANIKIEIKDKQYILTGDHGFKEIFTRLSSSVVKDQNGVEWGMQTNSNEEP